MTTVATLNDIRIQRTEKSRLSSVDFANLAFGAEFSDHMFVIDWDRGEWKAPRIIPYGDMSFSPAFSALHYGQTIFEGMKAFKSNDGGINIFRPYDHHERLNRSGERFCMPPVPKEIFVEGLRQLVSIDKDWVPEGGSLYLRPIFFATDELLGVHDSLTYRLIIFGSPVNAYYSAPLRVKVESNYIRASEGGVGYVKTAGNYARSLLSSREAKKEGFNVVLWLDSLNRKYVEEYSTMNAFFVIDDVVVTPIPSGTILEGITRDSIITILKDNNIPLAQREVSILEIMEAGEQGRLQEAFGTGTAAVAAPVELIDYNGSQVKLTDSSNWKVLNFVRNQLAGIRSGEVEDKYGWLMKI